MVDAEGQGYKPQGSSNLSTIPPTHADYIGMHLTVDNGNDGICVFVACMFSAGRAARQPERRHQGRAHWAEAGQFLQSRLCGLALTQEKGRWVQCM